MLKDETTAKELHSNIVKKMSIHLQEKSRVENNIVISGIKDTEDDNDDKSKVNDIMKVIGIDKDLIKKVRRKRRKASDKDKPKLEMIIVEFNDHVIQQTAIRNARKLKDNNDLKNIYLNPDKTLEEQKIDRDLRADRDKLNKALPHDENGGRHRYGIEKNGQKKDFKYHWGVRFGYGTPIKIYESVENKTKRVSAQVGLDSATEQRSAD